MNEKIRVGIVGAGGNTTSRHIPGLQAVEGVEISVVCNRSTESSQRVADTFGIPRIATHWQDVVDDPALDAIMIGTWPYLHAPISIAALNAGKHVLCEARMAMNAKEAVEMLAASKSHPDLIAQIVPSPFTLTWDRFIKRQLNEGLIGDVLAVDVFANAGAFINYDREMNWRDDVHLSGLNTMMLGIYYEALARWLGHAETIKAHGRIQVKRRRDAEGQLRDLHIPDHLDVFGDLICGASYHIRCSQLTGACPTPNDFIIYGSEGTLRVNITSGELILTRPDNQVEALDVPDAEKEYWRVEAEFIGAIQGNERIRLTSFPEAYKYMRFTQKVADELQLAPSDIRNP
ncbi:Gfo/Idh/MocA family oxidoreductase [Kiritimatiellaeota bacterium B1221]|nr:Gfo/Idh/MocA family oxidoreductase [Kiritimatiellaeota bacterium B1221]